MPHTPSGGGNIAPPMAPLPSVRMSTKALRSRLSAIARRRSALSKGGAERLTIIVRLPLSRTSSQIACGTWLLISFSSGIDTPNGKDIKSQVPQAICELVLDNGSRTMIVNRSAPPFDNADLRRAMALSLDRKAFVDILTEGKGAIGGAMLPPPEGVWGMPPDVLMNLPVYAADAQSSRREARALMEKLGYGPSKRLAVTVSTRNVPAYRESAVLMIDQLKEIYIDGQLEPIETVNWFPKVIRKDYSVGFTVTETAL